jgi:Ubiquinone biosynthesis protein COQ7
VHVRCCIIFLPLYLHLLYNDGQIQESGGYRFTTMMYARCLTHPRPWSRPRFCSFIHTQRHMPSSAYLDPARSSDLSVSSTPDNLSSSQRKLLEAALRVDQAGEVAANYIYEGQLAILRRDPTTAALIQVCLRYLHFVFRYLNTVTTEYVGPREKAPCCHEQAPSSAPS